MSLSLVLGGGLGNQLFQYAAAWTQAKRLGVEVEIDSRFYYDKYIGGSKGLWLDQLPVSARIICYPVSGMLRAHAPLRRVKRKLIDERIRSIYREPGLGYDAKFFQISNGTIIYGLFQSYMYFHPLSDQLKKELDLSWLLPSDYVAKYKFDKYISIHVRRGDYLRMGAEFQILDMESYYEKAMDMFRSVHQDTEFLVFSDDIEWCRSSGLFKDDCEYFDDSSIVAGAEMYLMGQCSGHIIANSSFSLWAAIVGLENGKRVIAPRKWIYGLDSIDCKIVPDHWETL